MGADRQAGALAVTCVFPILALIFVGARTFCRYLGQNFGWDDWLIHLSLLLLLAQTLTIYEYIIVSHTGYRSSEVPKQTLEQLIHARKWSFAVQMFYHPLMGAIRASIIMFLFRVKDERWHIRWALHVVFWMNVGYFTSTTLVNIFQCDPIRYAYLQPLMDHTDADGNEVAGGKCINSLQFIMSSCALSIFMDLIIMPIPTAMVWNLQMKRKTKMVVVAVMSMGWIATIGSVARLIVYYHRYAPTTDRTYNIGVVSSVTEPSVGIIAACAPALRRLLTYMLPRYFSDDGTYPSYHYETNNATCGHSRQRRPGSLTRAIDQNTDMDTVIREDGREEDEEMVYGLSDLRGKESREPMRIQRTQSGRTGVSDGTGQPCSVNATQPFDMLDHRQ
ncbi:hypothetical protein PMIN06_001784 [Paraphaeosphaeria minitans]|uniref:CFEM domain-containing protein n=1 Tax=Paraphaeosphaeria minitans TaxID=565426 RepID=A0A9P6GM95_9PLEO|nr:CFEM domain-containing protein [Paraphaeosphaeria minitans]